MSNESLILKPCPFCHRHSYELGAKVEIVTAENGYEHWVECKDCVARGPQFDFDAAPLDFAEIAADWNKALTPSPDRGMHYALLNVLNTIKFALNNSRNEAEALHTIGNEVSWALAKWQLPSEDPETIQTTPVCKHSSDECIQTEQPDDCSPELRRRIDFWSMRPQPGTPQGEAWEQGCRQGYEWGLESAIKRESVAPLKAAIRSLSGAIDRLHDIVRGESLEHDASEIATIINRAQDEARAVLGDDEQGRWDSDDK